MVEPVATTIKVKGDKNKIATSVFVLKSADYGGRAILSGIHA
jgi:hypothetical protein